MALEGPAIYDDDGVFQTYMQRRNRLDGPKETLEFPVLRDLIGDARGLRILDLGIAVWCCHVGSGICH